MLSGKQSTQSSMKFRKVLKVEVWWKRRPQTVLVCIRNVKHLGTVDWQYLGLLVGYTLGWLKVICYIGKA